MFSQFECIIGKCIKGVVVKESDTPPKKQVFLVFTDETYYEFYGEDFTGAKGINKGGVKEVKNYMSEGSTIRFEACNEDLRTTTQNNSV